MSAPMTHEHVIPQSRAILRGEPDEGHRRVRRHALRPEAGRRREASAELPLRVQYPSGTRWARAFQGTSGLVLGR